MQIGEGGGGEGGGISFRYTYSKFTYKLSNEITRSKTMCTNITIIFVVELTFSVTKGNQYMCAVRASF